MIKLANIELVWNKNFDHLFLDNQRIIIWMSHIFEIIINIIFTLYLLI